MRCSHALVPLFATLTLVACGEEQTATAPVTAPPAATTAERPAAPPVTTTTAPPAAISAPPVATAAIPSTTGATGTADTGGVTATPTTSGAAPVGSAASSQSAVVAAPANLQSFHGRSYSAGPVSVRLNPDNTFEMNQTDGNKKVIGRYNYENGIVRFSEPQGDVGGAQFPMQCRFEAAGTSEFRLAENNGSCTRFKDMSFKPAAG